MRTEHAPKKPGDEVPAKTPQTGENICRRCAGKGQLDGKQCTECEGSGTVTTTVGDA